jgi:signal transduction histidine kinase
VIFNNLISRVILLTIMLLSTGIGIFTLFHIQREEAHLIDATRESAELLLETVEKSIFTSMSMGNSGDVQSILEHVGRNPHLAGLRIFHPDGTILKSSHPSEIGRQVNSKDLSLFVNKSLSGVFQVGDEPVLGMVKPIETNRRCFVCHAGGKRVVGVLNLNYSLNDMMAQIGETSSFFLGSTIIVVLLLSAGISFLLIRFVKRPIQKMAAKMSLVEDGDLTVRMNSKYNDEIGVLMNSFNSMVINLEKAQSEIEQCHYQQMARADRLASVGEMATGLAHEIKNPLAGISGAISVIADDFEEDDPRREIVREVLGQIKRLDKTVNDLLYFGRPGAPEFNLIDVNELVKSTLFFTSQHPESKNIHRIKELTKDLPTVYADEKQIQQVLFNVILNAIQAMPSGGTLQIETDHVWHNSTQFVLVKIIDSGKGISAEELEEVFVPFHTTKTQGTGLGLPICRQLMAQNDGTISVASRVGEGTTVTIELPATAVGAN